MCTILFAIAHKIVVRLLTIENSVAANVKETVDKNVMLSINRD